MSVVATFESQELLSNRRYAARRPLRLGAILADTGEEVTIHDISPTGMLIESSRELGCGDKLFVELPERGTTEATVVWQSGLFSGCEFALSIPSASVSAALLRSPVADKLFRAELETVEDATRPLFEGESAHFQADDRYSLRTRAAVILSCAGLSWGLIGLVVVQLF